MEFAMDCKVIYGFKLSLGKTFHCFDFPLSEYRWSRQKCLVWTLGW